VALLHRRTAATGRGVSGDLASSAAFLRRWRRTTRPRAHEGRVDRDVMSCPNWAGLLASRWFGALGCRIRTRLHGRTHYNLSTGLFRDRYETLGGFSH
jgi:hypothetical protein